MVLAHNMRRPTSTRCQEEVHPCRADRSPPPEQGDRKRQKRGVCRLSYEREWFRCPLSCGLHISLWSMWSGQHYVKRVYWITVEELLKKVSWCRNPCVSVWHARALWLLCSFDSSSDRRSYLRQRVFDTPRKIKLILDEEVWQICWCFWI